MSLGRSGVPAKLLIAVERRVVFTIEEMRPHAPALEHLLEYIDLEDRDPHCSWGAEGHREHAGTGVEGKLEERGKMCGEGESEERQALLVLQGRLIDMDNVPRVLEYDRGPDLVLLECWLP